MTPSRLGVLAACAIGLCAVAGLAVPAARTSKAVEVRYEGRIDFLAHYKRPGETRQYLIRQRFLTDGRRVRYENSTWSEGDSAGPPEVMLIDGADAYRRLPSGPWTKLAGARAAYYRREVVAGLPWIMARDRHLPGLAVSTRGGAVDSIVDRHAHPRLGDVRSAVRYRNDGTRAPAGFAQVEYHRDHHFALDVKRVSFGEMAVAESLFAAPAKFDPPPPDHDALTGTPVVKQLADGVWSVDLEAIDSRSLIVEFADHLAVIEMAVGSLNGETLVDVAKRQWPSKPIRYALFSHYHPHYTGGLRAFIAEGATVVTTAGNEAFVHEVAAYPFTIAPDRLRRAPRPAKVQAWRGRVELADSTNTLVAIDMGARNDHTDEFAIFWLPRAGLVFEAEQGWVTQNGVLRASRRAANLMAVLKDAGVDPKRFVQCWPMRGDRAEVSRAELDSLIAARGK